MKKKVFESYQEFANYVKKRASRIISEEAIENLGDPSKLEMNKNIKSYDNSLGHKTSVDSKGKFNIETEAPINTPKENTSIEQPIDVKMSERDEGTDGKWATAASVQGTEQKKKVSNELADGLANPDVTSKTGNPKVSTEADPTKKGGIEGDKNNATSMNKEDREDKQITPKTQVLGKGEKNKDGFSNGQTDQEINVTPKQETDKEKAELDAKIKTIQLPEAFKNKKELIQFIHENAIKLSQIL